MTSLGFPGAKTGEPEEWGIFSSHPPNEKPWFLSGSLHINGTIFWEAFNVGGWDYHQEVGDSIPTTIGDSTKMLSSACDVPGELPFASR